MARPSIAVGRGVKVYEPPAFGRQDAICTKVSNSTGVVDARLSRSGRTIRNIKYSDDVGDNTPYWVELPINYAAGSEGL